MCNTTPDVANILLFPMAILEIVAMQGLKDHHFLRFVYKLRSYSGKLRIIAIVAYFKLAGY